MVFFKVFQLVILLTTCLIYGPPLSTNSVKPLLSPWAYHQYLTEWYKSLIPKFPSYGFYPSCDQFFQLIFYYMFYSSGCTRQYWCSSRICPVTNSISFLNYMLMSPLHTTPYALTIDQQNKKTSKYKILAHLESDLSLISDQGRVCLVTFNATKTNFLHLSTRHSLPDYYPLKFNNPQINVILLLSLLTFLEHLFFLRNQTDMNTSFLLKNQF